MSVLIKGMKIPQNCAQCKLSDVFRMYRDNKEKLVIEYWCNAACKKIMGYDIFHGKHRPKFCPMEEIKESSYISHGTLETLKAQCAVPTLKM